MPAAASAGRRLEERIDRELERLSADGLFRSLALPAGVDFSSNDYLGLGRDAGFRAEVAARVATAAGNGEPLFAPASRLLRGHLAIHERIERRLAAFKGAEAALVLPSGWQANVTLLGGLLGPEDRAISDRLNHASLIDGLRASGCEKVIVPHLELEAIERELGRARPRGELFVVVESLYSMDGDFAPLAELARICREADAYLIVDEAHATGVRGESRGSGRIEECGVESDVLASVTTFGKALGLAGAAIAGPRRLIDLLVQRARPLLFSTAVPPLLLVAIEAALDRMEREPERRLRLRAAASRLRSTLAGAGLEVEPGASPIVPLLVGENGSAVDCARRVAERGYDVRAVRPPTVPAGTARIRISVHADHRDADLEGLAEALIEVLT